MAARRFYSWMKERAAAPTAGRWLAIFFVLEMFILVPLDPLLAFYCHERADKAWWFAGIAAISSTIGALIGYAFGLFLWDIIGPWIIGFVLSQETFDMFVTGYKHYQGWAVFVGGILPIPFKAITLSAGFCQLSIIPFMVAVLAARSVRFFAIAGITVHWGPRIKAFFQHYFNPVSKKEL